MPSGGTNWPEWLDLLGWWNRPLGYDEVWNRRRPSFWKWQVDLEITQYETSAAIFMQRIAFRRSVFLMVSFWLWAWLRAMLLSDAYSVDWSLSRLGETTSRIVCLHFRSIWGVCFIWFDYGDNWVLWIVVIFKLVNLRSARILAGYFHCRFMIGGRALLSERECTRHFCFLTRHRGYWWKRSSSGLSYFLTYRELNHLSFSWFCGNYSGTRLRDGQVLVISDSRVLLGFLVTADVVSSGFAVEWSLNCPTWKLHKNAIITRGSNYEYTIFDNIV